MVDQGSQVVYGMDYNGTSFARGGPIYMDCLISPITSIDEFQASVVFEFEMLQTEVCVSEDFSDELKIGELKILTDEEWVEKALEEDFDVINEHNEDVTQVTQQQHPQSSNGKEEGSNTNLENTRGVSNLQSSQTLCTDVEEIASQENVKKRKKRGRVFDRDLRAADLKDSLAKVEKFAKLKKKQDENKEAARLHSFDGSSQPTKEMIPNSEKIETLRALKFITSPLKLKPSSPTNNLIPISDQEIVLCVEVHGSTVASRKQEFLVLGKQKMTELRDSIYCLTDKIMESEEQYDPSGYFLVENFFYNDFRSQSAIDYSKPILDWLSDCKNEAEEKWEHIMNGQLVKKQKEILGYQSKTNLPIFKSRDMDSTRFCDLRFRLGAGYLYCHQGDCKHTLVIRDMRLIHKDDSHNMTMYPIRTFQYKIQWNKCDACFMRVASKITIDDKWAKKNPCYFCDNCYYLLHYGENGCLLYNDFTVYDNWHT
ncbi:putative snRNA-activating protein complex subunit [Zostera marina]|uniref:Putative snRNA-activating protein complex subunit n=1 Tax=Zostera marina TaxID=29655 RepID=A0A0K9NK69_ZOSMR|nr:putative snRNA-activating protein complex subunit [Zostera marina]